MQSPVEILKQLTPEAMVALGLQEVAYVKPVDAEGGQLFEVHSADGTAMARFATRDLAFAACRQNELEPLSVH